MRGYVKSVLVFIVAIFMFFPQSVSAVGEYNGFWKGSFTVGSETWSGVYVIYQETSGSIFIGDECFGSIELVQSGNNWVLPAPIYSVDCGIGYNSYTFTFQNQTYLTGLAEIKEDSDTYTGSFSASKQNCQTLLNGISPAGLSGAEDSFKCFQVDLSAGTPSLTVTTAGGAGDCDLFVTYHRPPFDSYYSDGSYNNEYVYIASPAFGTWYVLLYGYTSYSGVVLSATYEAIQGPDAAFTANPTSGRVPLAASFTDQSTGNITSWSWNFGDGAMSTEQNPTHTFRRPGTYTVSLTVTGPAGSDTEQKTGFISALRSRSMPWLPLLLGD